MKKLLFILSFIVSFSNVNAQFNTCSGTTTAAAIGTSTASCTVVGDGTTGSIRICVDPNNLGSAKCSGVTERIRINESDGTSATIWRSSTYAGGATCFTLATTNGYACINTLCLSGTATITWETLTPGGVDACCTGDCTDGSQNCGETGIDCGGPCALCPPSCDPPFMTYADPLWTGANAGDPTLDHCSNGILDCNETGVDCGGADCPACLLNPNCVTMGISSLSGGDVTQDTINALAGDVTAQMCFTFSYTNSGNNWFHGVGISSGTGFDITSQTGVSAPGTLKATGTNYSWTFLSNPNFLSGNGGNNITAPGYYVETGNTDPGDNLGYPLAAGNNMTFCYNITTDCAAAGAGPHASEIGLYVTSDSYSGSWTDVSCGEENGISSGLTYVVDCPLTVGQIFVDFNLESYNNNVEVSWTVQGEKDISSYEVLRSRDAKNFKSIAKLSSLGSDNSISRYSHTDKDAKAGVFYYKIKKTSTSGKSTYTDIKEINLTFKDLYFNSVTPNPFSEELNVNLFSSNESEINISIFDYSGRKVELGNYQLSKGINSIDLNLEKMPKGMYYLVADNQKEYIGIKVIKE